MSMPPRQLWFFQFGCWATIVTAAVHMVGHVMPPAAPLNDTERQIMDLTTAYRFTLPGGAHRSVVNFLDGFSLMFALGLAGLGCIGLIVQKRGRHDGPLMSGVARALAVTSVGFMVVSLTNFFIIPTFFLAIMAICFLVASVEPPRPVEDARGSG
jgi:hypothetical protein